MLAGADRVRFGRAAKAWVGKKKKSNTQLGVKGRNAFSFGRSHVRAIRIPKGRHQRIG
jgi:hypothetical protein